MVTVQKVINALELTLPTPGMSQDAARAFVFEQFSKAGLPAPTGMDPAKAFVAATYLSQGKPLPKWLAEYEAAEQSRGRKPTLDGLESALKKVDGALDDYATKTGQRFADVDERLMLALPTPMDAALSDSDPDNKSPNGHPHGDAKVMRRRRATELERLIKDNRKRALAKVEGSEARIRWDREYAELNAELAAIREAERAERDNYKKV